MLRHRISMLLAAMATSLTSPYPAAAEVPSVAERPFYDPSLHAIVVPFRGSVPGLSVGHIPHPICSYVDFAATPLTGLMRGRIAHPPASWAMVTRGPHRSRLSLMFRYRTAIRVVSEPSCGRVLIYLLGARQKPAGLLGAPAVPFTPPVPPTAPTPAPTSTPLSTPEPTPFFNPPPAPTPAPALPHTPPPTPAPTPAAWAPSTRARWMLGGSETLENYRENYLPGDTQVAISNVAREGLLLDARLPASGSAWFRPDVYAGARFSTSAYTFQDKNLPLSIHAREEWRGELLATRRIGWPLLYLETGLGYFLRWENAVHSGAPPQPSYVFSSLRVFHGPEIALGAAWVLGEDWPVYLRTMRLYATGAVAPYAFSQIDRNLTALPQLSAGHAEYGIERPLGPLALRLAYSTWWTGGFGGYEELFQGPMLSITNYNPADTAR